MDEDWPTAGLQRHITAPGCQCDDGQDNTEEKPAQCLVAMGRDRPWRARIGATHAGGRMARSCSFAISTCACRHACLENHPEVCYDTITPMKNRTVLALLAAGAALVIIAVRQMPDGRLHVFLLDVDGGQGAIVCTAGGSVTVIDGGSSPSVLLTALGKYLPFWQRDLRAVIATQQGNSAITPLMDASKRYDVAFALGPPSGSRPGAAYESWRSLLQERRVPLIEAQAGMVVDLADGTLIEVDVASTTLAPAPDLRTYKSVLARPAHPIVATPRRDCCRPPAGGESNARITTAGHGAGRRLLHW